MVAVHAVQIVAGMAMLAAAVVATQARAADPQAAPAADPRTRADLQAVSRLSVFFGHQSVGGNILEGVQRLAAQEGVPLAVVEGAPGAAGIAHAYVGQNGDPAGKIDAFAAAVDAGKPADVALMKLCYVDFHAGTDPAALFARYQAALAALQRRHPGTTFVHLTAPLTTIQGGWKPLVKRLLGRETSAAENARREDFNARVRAAYAGKEPLFDVARLESTRPDGSVAAVEWKGRQVPILAAGYTEDGGHLNAAGQDRLARALVAFLAALPRAAKP
jgi:hypothetical protein